MISKINRRVFLAASGILGIKTAFGAQLPKLKDAKRPNIIWIMAEDITCDLACYGTAAVKTPNLDQMAKDGLKCNRAYVTGPICSPSRSAMMTGMYQTTINAHHHRSHRADGYKLPDPIKPITYCLRQTGYYCAVGCGYGKKTDLNYEAENLFDGDNWSNRADGQPFFAQIQLRNTHRGTWWDKVRNESKHPVDPDKVKLPPTLPDHPDVRMDWAKYLDQMEKVDDEVGEILARLEKEKIADSTMVIFIGDNGRDNIRGKRLLYEEGIRVPLIIRWPGRIEPETVTDELVSMIDMSAQILASAGAAVPEYMQGRPFLEKDAKPRHYVFAARDRCDDVEDKIRCVVSKRYKYIRNDMPQVPWDPFYQYVEKSYVGTTYPLVRKMHRDGQLNAAQSRYFEPRKPDEELYDLQEDPFELVNLAGKEQYDGVCRQLRDELKKWEIETDDKGRTPETDESKGREVIESIEYARHAKKKVLP